MPSTTLTCQLFSSFFFITILTCINVSSANKALMACEASRDTVKQVQKCPLNEDQWREAARRKKCEEIVQNCSGGHEFVYHCLINSWGNETVEVCALRANIIGNCAEYNVLGAVVQDHYSTECTQCPAVYPSDKAFLYQECYKLVKRDDQEKIHPVTSGTNHISCAKRNVRNIGLYHVLSFALGGFIISSLQ
ncbi:uncharacterized protein LOC125675328 isoform X2 [Ostrea edulis]|uniref:uncharacterized protein LOC125675328 isoform X2 n=1 Tax=Ostrea edulis TaxID=37623 RepID=UPI002095A1B1|nr:uncharacterized protein LOC125675328 isoform X2 [Ostrea edulis]XP_048768875.1 uncharacterized protein LOC125675328 isoform X2 [Ostrea edulis]XP_056013982.1 uncharacterized protein LOC125675328 isoform X2 [Ostrea edulis]